jgi:hypothetical protein
MNTKSNGIKIINNIPDQFKERFIIFIPLISDIE